MKTSLLARLASLALLGSVILPLSAWAVPEGNLLRDYAPVIAPYFQSGQAGEFAGQDGIPIRYRTFEKAAGTERGAIVIVSGRGEFMPKYSELIYDLRDAGYSIYILDHRGQGQSGRMLPDTEKGYVHEFGDYLADFDYFLKKVVLAKRHRKVFALSHSLGGAILTDYLLTHPHAFDAAAFVSPMYQMNLGKYSEAEAYLIAAAEVTIGLGTNYCPGRNGDEWKAPFAQNDVTYSEARYVLPQEILLNDDAMALGGPTLRWLMEALEADWRVRAEASSLHLPMLMFQAGDDEIVVTPSENEVCGKARDCRLEAFAHARHELLMEKDDVRSQVVSDIMSFFNAHN